MTEITYSLPDNFPWRIFQSSLPANPEWLFLDESTDQEFYLEVEADEGFGAYSKLSFGNLRPASAPQIREWMLLGL